MRDTLNRVYTCVLAPGRILAFVNQHIALLSLLAARALFSLASLPLPLPYLHLLVHHHSTTPSSSNPFNIKSGHGSQICHPWGGGTPICPRPVCTLPVVVPWQDDRFPSWCTSWPPIVFWNKAVLLKRRLYIQLSKFIVDRRLSIAISFHPWNPMTHVCQLTKTS